MLRLIRQVGSQSTALRPVTKNIGDLYNHLCLGAAAVQLGILAPKTLLQL